MKQVIMIVWLLCSFSAFSQPGLLDNTFDGDGKLQVPVTGGLYSPALPRSVVLQPDGKLLTCGSVFNGTNYDMIIFRFNSNGTPDNSFDGDGRAITSNGFNDYAFRIALQSDGKIVAVGYTTPDASTTGWDIIVTRHNTDGTPDNSFDGDGKVITNVTSSDFGLGLAIQADGKIVVGGNDDAITSAGNSVVLRYNSNGTLDNTFSGDGKAILTNFATRDYIYDLKIQPDGKIVTLAFNHYQTGPDRFQAVISRLNTDGTPDNSFDTDGTITFGPFGFPYFDVRLYSIALQSDGKIVSAGTVLDANNSNAANPVIARFNTDGSPDNSFDGDGFRIPGTGSIHQFMDVLAMSDGRLLAVGPYNQNTSFCIRSFTATGADDVGFNGTGLSIYNISASPSDFEFAHGIAMQSNGYLIVTGLVQQSAGSLNDLAMIRAIGFSPTLPVSLLNFKGQLQGATVSLSWETATELNNKGFEVLHSTNGVNFMKIGFVEGAGNSNALLQYGFTHIQPTKGNNFYRIKQVDFDNRNSLSKIVLLRIEDKPVINFYPNPLQEVLNIQVPGKVSSITLFDEKGRKLWQQKQVAAGTTSIDMNAFPKGFLLLQFVLQDGKMENYKLVKM